MRRVLQDLISNSAYLTNESPFRGFLQQGASASRTCLLTGPNASGKSLLSKVLCGQLTRSGITPYQVSMRHRTEPGFRRAVMYGSEQDQSTGATSLEAVFGALRTSSTDSEPHWLILDEPDVGLSDDYAGALGIRLASYQNALPAAAQGLLIISHSRSLATGFVKHATCTPHFLHMGCAYTLDDWLAAPAYRSISELEALVDLGRQHQSAIQRIIRTIKQPQ